MMRPIFTTVIILTCLIAFAPAQSQVANLSQIEPALAKVASYEYGQDFKPLAEVTEFVRATKSNAELLARLEERLIGFLGSKATIEGRKFVCEQLSLIGTKASVPVLTRMLAETETGDMARYALERIPAPEAGEALRTALAKVNGKQKAGVITSLGQRRDSQAVPLLAPLAAGDDPTIAVAAVNALGRIGDPAALKALTDLRKTAAGPIRAQVLDALVRCLEQHALKGDKQQALAGYKELYSSNEAAIVKVAALRGLAGLDGAGAVPVLGQALEKGEDQVRAIAIQLLAAIPSAEVTNLLTGSYAKLPAPGRVQLLTALVSRGDSATASLLASALKDDAIEVRVAALEGMGKLGDASQVLPLAKIAADSEGAERGAARLSLYRLKAEGVDKAILDNLDSGSARVKIELVRATGERRIEAAADALLKTAKDSNPEVRRESRRALRETAQTSHIPALLQLLDQSKSASERADIEMALVSTVRRYEMAGVDPVVSALGSSANIDTKASLLIVLGRLGQPQGLQLLRAALKDDQTTVQRAAILGLTEWPTPEPLDDLLQAARTSTVRSHQVLALRGYLRLVGVRSRRSRAESVKLLEDGLKLAQQDDEKKAILSLLPRFASPQALKVAESLQEGSVAEEAKQAIERIKRSMP